MENLQNLHVINARPVPDLATATDNWLAARDNFKLLPSNENLHNYEATRNNLGVAWSERYPDAADTPGAFELYRRGLIAPADE
ncbi:MAG: hypothetical protein ABSE99_17635 [Terracidiphilus sp.]|jgi:hypothetical protein